MLQMITTQLNRCDLLVFSDFNYGCLPDPLIHKCMSAAHDLKITCVADSQCSSQVGDVSRFKGMNLISATEREARIALRDNDDGLTMIATRLLAAADSKNVMLKLGSEGVLINTLKQRSGVLTSQLPAFNQNPTDVAGAGDSMLIATGMALALGSSIWEAALIGSMAAAIQISSVGNSPISGCELRKIISDLR
jgi:bifunctional ADP-heptose synthase (sugar kinase/adenylyltransferase)